MGPVAGAVADRLGWRATLVGALTGLLALLSLVGTLPAVVAALAVLTVAMFSGATAAQIGVATQATPTRGRRAPSISSCYYTCGAFAGYVPVSLAVVRVAWSHRRRSRGIGAGRESYCCSQESFASIARSISPDYSRR